MARPSELNDPVALARAFIRHPSVTPNVSDALEYLEGLLKTLGFSCERLVFGEGDARVENLYARRGEHPPHFSFAGHMDVVPAGSEREWSVAPFEGLERDGHLFGRGAVDMKGAIAAFVHAVAQQETPPRGSISLLITGDEEGPAINGTAKMLGWLQEQGESIDDCLVGEPTCRERLGDTIKIGRRGSLNLRLHVQGTAGHAAYPELARNPLPTLSRMVAALSDLRLDEGTEQFQPSTLTCTSIDTGNPAGNVIPGEARAQLNIRFNDQHTSASLEQQLRSVLDDIASESGCSYALEGVESGKPFLGKAERMVELLDAAIHQHTGLHPQLSTGGGTSDARFIREYARVVEFGLVGSSMHQADERVGVEELKQLARIYATLLDRYFSTDTQGAKR